MFGVDLRFVDECAVAAFQIADVPLVVAEENFSVVAAAPIVFHDDLVRRRATDEAVWPGTRRKRRSSGPLRESHQVCEAGGHKSGDVPSKWEVQKPGRRPDDAT